MIGNTELTSVFFPAHDNAGILTSSIIFIHSRNIRVRAKLRKEVLDIGEQKWIFELLKSLKYDRLS